MFLVFADTRSLQCLYTAFTSRARFLAVALVNGQQVMCYSNATLITEDWIKKAESEDFWRHQILEMDDFQDGFKSKFTAWKQFNHSKGKEEHFSVFFFYTGKWRWVLMLLAFRAFSSV